MYVCTEGGVTALTPPGGGDPLFFAYHEVLCLFTFLT
jgi:hypothetical protein